MMKLDGNEIWEALFGIMKGGVPEEMTEAVCAELAEGLNKAAHSHHAYPHLARLVNEMSHANGGTAARTIKGLDADADRMELLDANLTIDDNVPPEAVSALNFWLGGLPEEQFQTIVDGEEGEVAAILAAAPRMNETTSGQQYIDHLYDETV